MRLPATVNLPPVDEDAGMVAVNVDVAWAGVAALAGAVCGAGGHLMS